MMPILLQKEPALCDAVKISASALKNMNRADHLLLLPSSIIQL